MGLLFGITIVCFCFFTANNVAAENDSDDDDNGEKEKIDDH